MSTRPDQDPSTHRITVSRTARYVVTGALAAATREVWIVLHGYGQRAADFAREFDALTSDARAIVAPEGLSRFYVQGGAGEVGASWMTREERDDEIADYVAYLDAVHAAIRAQIADAGGGEPRIVVLGFSQGSATAYRWVTRGASRVDRLIAWAGDVPPDLELDALRDFARGERRLTLVLGSRDAYVDDARLAKELERLRRVELDFELVRFEGGHRLDRDTLAALAR